jgi:hypothetical protein
LQEKIIVVVGGAALALALQGQFVAEPQLLWVGLAVSLWILLWIALSACIATFWRGAIASIVPLMLIWSRRV